MAKRRNLKKAINHISSELFAECMYLKATAGEKAQEAIDEQMVNILRLQNEHISRISHTEPGNVKGFYKKLRTDFSAGVSEIVEGLKKCAE
ncbi:MAG: hypothetical protein Q4D30_02030 [Bacteroidales bacterium]|jgi:hypothetical protein|nr:hypothetical protein [Bacteroidaceae bacterium]MBR3014680.1 hypothetical protein [Bacteroidaceae bacterium]MBR3718082.1 hypothetical protein [Bacteroidaceae bacterium]MDO4185255.1 hypothetical protein [Bacteroidales bacterium]